MFGPWDPPALSVGDGPEDGAHRLTVRVDGSTDRWVHVARELTGDLECAKREGAWQGSVRLDLVGWDAGDCEARFYLAGSALSWVALAGAGLDVPVLAHVPIVLGQPVRHWRLDRRPLELPTYDQITGRGWPFRTDGPAGARRVEVGAPSMSRRQLEGLVDLLASPLRTGFWERGLIPDGARPVLDGDVVVLPAPGLRAGAVLGVVHLWSQLYWVEVEWIRWTS